MHEELTSYDAPDPRLWVRLAPSWSPDPLLRWLIAGSAHTHRGHFHVCSETGDEHRSVNLADVIEVSPEAEIWLDGFLHGQEADTWEYFGSDAELWEEADEDDMERWRAWNARFRRQGFAPSLEPLPPRGIQLGDLADPPAWCFAGGLFRIWSDGDWVLAEPQPTGDARGDFWPGSVCEEITAHDLDEVDGVLVCNRCHRVD